MCNIQQQKNSHCHATRIHQIGPQTTSDTPQNVQLYETRICKLGQKTKTFKNIGYEMALFERKLGA